MNKIFKHKAIKQNIVPQFIRRSNKFFFKSLKILKFSTERNILSEILKDKNLTLEQLRSIVEVESEEKISPIIKKNERLLFSDMGIDFKDNAPMSYRKEKCEYIEDNLNKTPVLLLKGTKATGKTSMGEAYGEHIKKQGKGYYYLNVDTITTIQDFKKAIAKQINFKFEGIDWEKITFQNILEEVEDDDCHFVIDETQKIYNENTFGEFWSYIKSFIDNYRNQKRSKLKFLFLSNYVSISIDPVTKEKIINITPLSLANLTEPISFLLCIPEEMDEINQRFNREVDPFLPGLKISNEIRDYIFEQSGAHIGIIHHYYKYIYRRIRESKRYEYNIDDGDIIGYLRSSAFTNHLSKYRGFDDYDYLTHDDRSREILIELFESEEDRISTSSPSFNKVIFKELTARGIIITDDEYYYTWAFPFQRTLMLKYIFHSDKRNAKVWKSEQLDDFIKESLKRVDGKTISRNISSSEGVDHLLERPIQRIVGTTFNSLLDPRHTIHYEASRNTPYNKGKYLKIEGFMDFFINDGLGWAIELLVEKNKPYEHLFRLLFGKYSKDKSIKNFVVVHFLLNKSPDLKTGLDELPKGMWNVIFSKDLKVAKVIPWNKNGKSPKGQDNWSVINEETKVPFDVKGYYGEPYHIN